jgi:drug/metabolite transporter (DMT)-like permease
VSSSGIRGSVDLFDDPPWTSSPTDRHQGRWSAIATLGLCLLSAVGAAISTTLPWFGLDESLGVGFLRLQDQMSALSRYLQPAQFDSFSPGAQAWGYVILALSCGVAMSAIMTLGTHVVRQRTPFGLYVVVVALALLLVIATVLEAHAKPSFGDGPPLRFSWGAVVGVAAATTSLIGACSAAILRR